MFVALPWSSRSSRPQHTELGRAWGPQCGGINTVYEDPTHVHDALSSVPPRTLARPDMTNANGRQLVQPVPELPPEIFSNIIAQTSDRSTRDAFRLVNKWFAHTVSVRRPEHLTPVVRQFAYKANRVNVEADVRSAFVPSLSPSAQLAMPLIPRMTFHHSEHWDRKRLTWAIGLVTGLKSVCMAGRDWRYVESDAEWQRLSNIVELEVSNIHTPFGFAAGITAHTPKLRRLDMSRNLADDTAKLVDALASVPDLEHLNLRSNQIGKKGVSDLSRALTAVPKLRFLDLFDNRMGNCTNAEAVAALGQGFAALPALEHLNLRCGGRAGFAALVTVPMPQLRCLVLGGNALDGSDMGSLGYALESGLLPNLRRLELDLNKITARGARQFLFALTHAPHLEHLTLSRNELGRAGALDLPLAAAPNLRHLDLSHNKLTVGHVRGLRLSDVPRLRVLDLSNNPLGPDSVGSLNLALADASRLQELRLGCTGIGTEQVASLALEQWPELRILDVSGSKARARDDLRDGLRARLPALQRLVI